MPATRVYPNLKFYKYDFPFSFFFFFFVKRSHGKLFDNSIFFNEVLPNPRVPERQQQEGPAPGADSSLTQSSEHTRHGHISHQQQT